MIAQCWYLVNLDKYEYLIESGGTDLFEQTYQHILHLLIRPNKYIPITPQELEDEIKEWDASWPQDDASKSVREYYRSKCEKHTNTSKCASSMSPGILSRLPTELLHMVVAELEECRDIISIGLTSKIFFFIAHHNIQNRFLQDIPWWRGDRIICLGDFCADPEVLRRAFTEDVVTEFENALNKPGREGRPFHITGLSAIHILHETGKFKEANMHNSHDCLNTWELLKGFGMNNTFVESQIIDHLVKPAIIYDHDLTWVLCNLSKKQYVLADDIAKATGHEPNGAWFGQLLTFAEVLAPYLCLAESDTRPGYRIYEGDVTCGPWMGDRFDITTTNRIDLTEWTDVTCKVIENLQRMWKRCYGEEWKEKTWPMDDW
ncbi:hypothetical protein QCA50_004136 [Cerrena zonata]|uniref:F-box domain-containing protein n=1 Tax=Cerrena zonata TaxID=2478898 RepID=A0AAW0GN39_9APHY